MLLCYYFFKKGYFPVSIAKENEKFRDWLFSIKTNPSQLDKKTATEWLDVYEYRVKESFSSRDQSKDYKFNEVLANKIILELYLPYLK